MHRGRSVPSLAACRSACLWHISRRPVVLFINVRLPSSLCLRERVNVELPGVLSPSGPGRSGTSSVNHADTYKTGLTP